MSHHPDNPWGFFIDNVIAGDNYFRSSEYIDLNCDIDGYCETITALRAQLAAVREANFKLLMDSADKAEKIAAKDKALGLAKAGLVYASSCMHGDDGSCCDCSVYPDGHTTLCCIHKALLAIKEAQ